MECAVSTLSLQMHCILLQFVSLFPSNIFAISAMPLQLPIRPIRTNGISLRLDWSYGSYIVPNVAVGPLSPFKKAQHHIHASFRVIQYQNSSANQISLQLWESHNLLVTHSEFRVLAQQIGE